MQQLRFSDTMESAHLTSGLTITFSLGSEEHTFRNTTNNERTGQKFLQKMEYTSQEVAYGMEIRAQTVGK
jgi:hypothetical protein